MQKSLHPHRYRKTMSAAIARLEDIAISTESSKRLEEEFSGLTQAELSKRRDDLNHIEPLIADWISHGCRALDATASVVDLVASECMPFTLSTAFCVGVTYINFGQSDRMALQSQDTNFVEGFYFREIAGDESDALEITLVCNGPEWNDLELKPYGRALRTASQIAVCAIPNGSTLPHALDIAVFHGDDGFISDDVFPSARRLIGNMIGILQASADRPGTSDLGPLH